MDDKRRILLKLQFDGSGFCGWQAQQNGKSIQQTIQDSFEIVFKERPGISGCGRTDSGVHALSYYCHTDISRKFTVETIPNSLNLYFHHKNIKISVVEAREVDGDFHSRYWIERKQYIYKIQNNRFRDPFLEGKVLYYFAPLNLDAMRIAAKYFLGEHNFSSFMAKKSDIPKSEAIRKFYSLDIAEYSSSSNVIELQMTASGFLYKMARIIAGTLIEVGEGKIDPHSIPHIISAQNRNAAGRTLPPHGLYLANIQFYPTNPLP